MPYKVFLTHSERNYPIVRFVADDLAAQGFRPLLAQEIPPREHPQGLPQKISELIDESDWVLALITKESVESPWVHQEIGHAIGRRPLIALVEAGIEPSRLGFLQGKEYISLDRNRIEDSLPKLQEWAHELRERKNTDRALVRAAVVTGLVAITAVAIWYTTRPASSPTAPEAAPTSPGPAPPPATV